jgi:hypothetical protein
MDLFTDTVLAMLGFFFFAGVFMEAAPQRVGREIEGNARTQINHHPATVNKKILGRS